MAVVNLAGAVQDRAEAIALPRRTARVLLAEDNPVDQQVIVRLLGKVGAETDVAPNGRVAVSMALSKLYDVIFMDYHMPDMNGVEATEEIRAGTRGGRRIPIVALTASVMDWE